jgi:xylose isomerase
MDRSAPVSIQLEVGVKKAIEINTKAVRIINERIESLPHERIIDCYINPSRNRGKLEEILLNSMRTR